MDKPKQETIDNAIKLLGEVFAPGASLLMDGKIVSGSIHLIAGTWAKAAIGPVGAAIVVANSYAESATGKSLLKHFSQFAEEMQSKAPKEPGPAGDEASADPGPADNEPGPAESEG